jgi:hypothetical protein
MTRIYWEKYPRYMSSLSDPVREEFEMLFGGTYYQRKLLSHDLVSLNERLTFLPIQELDIFLSLKGESTANPPIYDVTFTELLLYRLENTSPEAKRKILLALKYIVTNNSNSRTYILESTSVLERIARSNGTQAELSKEILQIADSEFCVPRRPNYQFTPGQPYQFYTVAKMIFERTSGSLMIIDNYATDEVIEYIDNYCDCNSISNIYIICNNQAPNNKSAERRIKPLKHAIIKFSQEYPNINIELKSNVDIHDRYLITDKEVWQFGPSLKDGGKKACTINQLKDEAESVARSSFQDIWDKSVLI